MVFKAISNKISVIYCGSQFYWWRKLEYPDQENATDLQQKSLAKMDLYTGTCTKNKEAQIFCMYRMYKLKYIINLQYRYWYISIYLNYNMVQCT
jgi:hypothetical protein